MKKGFMRVSLLISAAVICAAAVIGFIFGGFSKGLDYTGGTAVTVKLPPENTYDDFCSRLMKLEGVSGNVNVIVSEKTKDTVIYIAEIEETGTDSESFKKLVESEFTDRYNDKEAAIVFECIKFGPRSSVKDLVLPFIALAAALLVPAVYVLIRHGLRYGISAFAAPVLASVLMLAVVMMARIDISRNLMSAVYLTSASTLLAVITGLLIRTYNEKNTSRMKSTVEEIAKNAKKQVRYVILAVVLCFAIALVFGLIFQAELMRELLIQFAVGCVCALFCAYAAVFGTAEEK